MLQLQSSGNELTSIKEELQTDIYINNHTTKFADHKKNGFR